MSYPDSWYWRTDENGTLRCYTLDYAGKEREVVAEELGSYREWKYRTSNPWYGKSGKFVGKELDPENLRGVQESEDLSAKAGSGVRSIELSDSVDPSKSLATEESSVLEPHNTELGSAVWAAIILSGIFIVGAFLALFLPTSPYYVFTEKDSGSEEPNEDSNPEDAFALSSNHFLNAYAALENPNPEKDWESSSAACYAAQNTEFADLIRQIAVTSQEVNVTAQTEAKQVDHGKETLENLAGGLQLAIPISRNLYFSGPIGPALSHNFQLAVTSSAVGAGNETTNTMHKNSSEHAENFTALTQRYADAPTFVVPADSETKPG
ncbi:MAG: hypothetical protein K2Q25_05705 [Mycobacteriaceae bacterium]|nr:hypothetical protein [Mycobacteriaceae bacterium]